MTPDYNRIRLVQDNFRLAVHKTPVLVNNLTTNATSPKQFSGMTSMSQKYSTAVCPGKILNYYSLSHDFELKDIGNTAPPIVISILYVVFLLLPDWYASSDVFLATTLAWAGTVLKLDVSR